MTVGLKLNKRKVTAQWFRTEVDGALEMSC